MPYFYDHINTIYQFINPFLDKKKMSIFEKYGTFNPFMIYNFASLFLCMPVCWALDWITAPFLSLFERVGTLLLLSVVGHILYSLDFLCSVFILPLSMPLNFNSVLWLLMYGLIILHPSLTGRGSGLRFNDGGFFNLRQRVGRTLNSFALALATEHIWSESNIVAARNTTAKFAFWFLLVVMLALWPFPVTATHFVFCFLSVWCSIWT